MTIHHSKTANILIVDDEPTNVLLLQRILEQDGYTQIHTTTNPLEVEALYSSRDFDLVLLDINMPELDGFGVMEKLMAIEAVRDNYPPILVLTASADLATRLRALKSGAKDFVTKPFERVEILSRIENMLEVRTLHNQIRQQNILLEDKVAERTQKLEEKANELLETRLEIIRRLGRAADYRDNETGTHIIRMSKYSELLGRACGMSNDEAELLLNASPMHDIGKIGTPDNILLKPGKLNASEWNVMKKHAEIGAEILSGHPSELIEQASLIALTHHEKWDGSGYPHQLQGEAIPLVARIVALTDVFDALTSHRPYKDAWSVDAALKQINALSAKHFDPVLVPVFNEIIGDIVAIKDQYSDANTVR